MIKYVVAGAGALALVLVAGCGGSAHAQRTVPSQGDASAGSPSPVATPSTSPSGAAAGHGYLALGDSVSFGYREATSVPTPNYADAASFVGFPQLVGAALGLQVANASCPGETSASFVRADAASFGCETLPKGGPGYRVAYPLHVAYTGTQLAYALSYLGSHPDTSLVTLMIGANDGFLCQESTKDGCVSELSTVLAQVAANVKTILGDIRSQARYTGQIVVVDYYSLDYTSALQNLVSNDLNSAVTTAAAPFTVEVADGYSAFKTAAAKAGGNSCQAGLLTKLTTGGCGVHPSATGQELLAAAVEQVVKK
jgi:lysophospholipase L1-like esterase